MSLRSLYARNNFKLVTLPEQFFLGQSKLFLIFLTGSTNFGSQAAQPLPAGLFRGLFGLVYFSMNYANFASLPDMSDLTVSFTPCTLNCTTEHQPHTLAPLAAPQRTSRTRLPSSARAQVRTSGRAGAPTVA